MAGIAALGGALVVGCAGDVSKRLVSDAAFQSSVMEAIAANPDLAGTMLDRLLAGETRALVMERVLANGGAVQGLMTRVAQDQTILDGVINLAVQDSAMRAHVLTLFKGMQMMGR
jgi:hypothetical protein